MPNYKVLKDFEYYFTIPPWKMEKAEYFQKIIDVDIRWNIYVVFFAISFEIPSPSCLTLKQDEQTTLKNEGI